MTPLRIALTGRGGTGKTTLASEMSRKLGLPLISESIRTAARQLGIRDIAHLTFEERLVLQSVALTWQIRQEAQYGETGFVSDRSAWDYLAYSDALLKCPASMVLFEHMVGTKDRYDLLIMVPPWSDSIPQDGFRFTEAFESTERSVESYIRRHAKPLLLTEKTAQMRLLQALEYVQDLTALSKAG